MESEIIAGRKPSLWTRDFVLLTLIQTIDLFTYNMITPVIAGYSLEQGIALSFSGILASAFAFAALAARPFSGFLADRFGQRRIVALSIAAALLVQIGYVVITNYTLIILLRVVHGVFYALFGTAIAALAAEAIPAGRQGEGMGWFGTSYVLANALGPALGVFLSSSFGFAAMFAVGAGITCVSLVLVAFVRTAGNRIVENPESATSAETDTRPTTESARLKKRNSFVSKACIPLAIVACCYISIWSIIVTYLVLVGDSRNIVGISLFFVVNSIALFFTRPIAGRQADRRGLAAVFRFSVVFEAVALVLLTASHQLWLFLVAAVCKALGSGTALPSVQATCAQQEPPERRGVAMSTYLLGTDIGYAFGPLIGGAVSGAFGFDPLFLIGFPILACGAAAFAWWRIKRV